MRTIRQAIGVTLALAAVLAMGGVGVAAQESQGEHHAGLVVQFADGSVRRYCLAFTGESIIGLDLLLKTGLEVKMEVYGGGMGGEVCKIGPDGCNYPGEICACQSYGPGGVYWNYHHLKNGKWLTSSLGAASYKVHDGDVEGWAWSDGKPPSLSTFGQICGSTQPQPTATATRARPTSTPTSRAAKPTQTRRPTVTANATRASTPIRPAASSATPRPKQPPAQTPTATPTSTATLTPTPEPTTTSTHTASASSTRTAAPTSTATAIPTPTIVAASAPARGDDMSQARMIAVLAGLGAALALVTWRGLATVRARRGGGHVD